MFFACLQLFVSACELPPSGTLEPLPHEWVYLRSRGESPDRNMQVIDKSSIDRTDIDEVKFRTAIIFEQSRRGISYIVSSHTVNCGEGSGLILFAELYSEGGEKVSRIDDEPNGDTLTDTPAGRRILGIACDDDWPEASISFASLKIPEIFPFWEALNALVKSSE